MHDTRERRLPKSGQPPVVAQHRNAGTEHAVRGAAGCTMLAWPAWHVAATYEGVPPVVGRAEHTVVACEERLHFGRPVREIPACNAQPRPCRLDPPTPPSAAPNCAAKSSREIAWGVRCAAPQLPQCCRPGCMVARCIVGCAVHCRLHRRLRAHASCPPVAISRLKSVVRWSAACHGTLPVALLPASRELRCERAVMRVASPSRTAHTLYRATLADD